MLRKVHDTSAIRPVAFSPEMKWSIKKTLRAAFSTPFLILLLTSRAAANTTATWTNGGGNNAWETSSNWDINQVPNSSAFDVRISTSSPCNLSSQFQIGALALSTTTANLSLAAGSDLGIASSAGIINNGTVVVNTTGGNSVANLRFTTSAAIMGSGTIQLNGTGPNASISADGVSITNGAGHTIHGRGDISTAANNAVLVNNGTFNADVYVGDPLRVFLSNALGNQNNGIMEATNAATLYFDQGFLDQSGGGSIVAVGYIVGASPPIPTVVSLGNSSTGHSPTIFGGTISSPTGTTFRFVRGQIQANNVFLNGCTLSAVVTSPPSGLIVILENGLINNDSIATSGNIRFDATAAITGTGKIQLGDPSTNIPATISANGVTVTHGAQHTIHGYGDGFLATNNAVLVNNGTFNADANKTLRFVLSNSGANQNNGILKASQLQSVLSLAEGRLDQTQGGTLFADTDSIVLLGQNQTFTVVGGTLGSSNTGAIKASSAVLAGSSITNSGSFRVLSNGLTAITATALTNNGTLTLEASSSLLRFDASTVVNGSGAIVLTNGGKAEISTGQSVTNGNAHSLQGTGTIQIDSGATLINNGIIAPGASPGLLSFEGNLQLGSSSNLSIEIGGTNQGTDYDLLEKSDAGVLTLNGSLTVRLINNFIPASTDTFTITTSHNALAGAFTNVSSGARLSAAGGSGSFIVSYNGNNVVLSDFIAASPTPTPTPTPAPTLTPTPTPTPAPFPPQPLNISTRLRVLAGDNALIGGFILTGTQPKKLIVRAIGPSLTKNGVSGALGDPTLELYDSGGHFLGSNDNWKGSQESDIIATGLAPDDPLESAILTTLTANAGYTAIVRGKDGSIGVALVEIYDLSLGADSRLANISARGYVDIGDDVMIGGFIVGGSNQDRTNVVIRAIGPSLIKAGISNALQDPTLSVYDQNGSAIGANDNWRDAQQPEIVANGLAPTDDRESALYESLPSGNYTAIVQGTHNTTGIALIEVYHVN